MKAKFIFITVSLFVSVLMIQCSEDNDDMKTEGRVNLKITDAPSDDANIQGTFVTVSDVKVDGKSVDGFSKQTIEISAYQNGDTKLLFNDDVEAGMYSDISLVLDYESDASGNSPGCYVLDTESMKHDLNSSSSSTGEITVDKSFMVESNSTTDLVVDFDLRKAIVHNQNSGETSEYKFVTNSEMKNSLRLVVEEKCGEIEGKVNYNGEKDLIVYAYHKGDFNTTTETQGQGSSGVVFAKAVTSSKVDASGNYQLSFMEEGDYEIHVASYDSESNGKFTFQGMANASSTISGLFLNNISIDANAQVELNIDVTISF